MIVHEYNASGIAVLLADLLEAAERETGTSPRVFRRQPLTLIHVDLLETTLVGSRSTASRVKSERSRKMKSRTWTLLLDAFEDLCNDGAQLAPGRDLDIETRAPTPGQLVVLCAPVVV